MGDGYGGHGWGDGMGWGGWLMMGLFVVVCLALLGGLLYWLVQGTRGGMSAQPSPPPTRPSAQSALDERFARGDIDEDEYLRRKSVLNAR
ncbi:MAG: SHOCT domain-containing protein [Nocardioides sp.]